MSKSEERQKLLGKLSKGLVYATPLLVAGAFATDAFAESKTLVVAEAEAAAEATEASAEGEAKAEGEAEGEAKAEGEAEGEAKAEAE